MPLHTTTSRTVLAALTAATCAIPGGTAVAIAAPSPPAATRYFDIEANKAAGMRALGLYLAEQPAQRTLS